MYNWSGSRLLELIILVLIASYHKGHTNIIVDESTLSLSHEMNFTNKAINARAHIALNLKEW